MGIFGPAAPDRLRQLRTAGQRTPEELIDRHQLACRPIRDLLVDYLRERQPAMDYASLEQLARRLGMFWADLEAHHPGIDSLHLQRPGRRRLETAACAPSRKTITTADGGKTVIDAERICHREFLTPVRAFYLDLAQWAVDDPARWGPWAAPCPVGPAETIQGKAQRHRKSRMDARTRERLPVLPVLVRSAARQHADDAEALLQAARDARPGDAITAPGTALIRSAATSAAVSIWADDPATGKRRNLTAEEDRAFWAWATIEVLRSTGIRVEELVQLSHHSLVQYRLPRHRRAGAAAADRPVQDRRRAAAGRQPRARRRAQRHHQPDPRHQPRPCPSSPPTTTTNASGCRPPRCCSSGASAPRTARSPPPPSARSSPAPWPAPA